MTRVLGCLQDRRTVGDTVAGNVGDTGLVVAVGSHGTMRRKYVEQAWYLVLMFLASA